MGIDFVKICAHHYPEYSLKEDYDLGYFQHTFTLSDYSKDQHTRVIFTTQELFARDAIEIINEIVALHKRAFERTNPNE